MIYEQLNIDSPRNRRQQRLKELSLKKLRVERAKWEWEEKQQLREQRQRKKGTQGQRLSQEPSSSSQRSKSPPQGPKRPSQDSKGVSRSRGSHLGMLGMSAAVGFGLGRMSMMPETSVPTSFHRKLGVMPVAQGVMPVVEQNMLQAHPPVLGQPQPEAPAKVSGKQERRSTRRLRNRN